MSFSYTAVVDATLTMSDGGASSLSSSFSSDGGEEHLTIRDMDRRRVRERTSRMTFVTSKMRAARTSRASHENDDDDDLRV